MCDVALEVERTPAALLSGQRLSDSGEYIPALWRLFEVVDGRVPLLLELKTTNGNAALLCREVVTDLASRNGLVGIMSFDPQVGRWLRTNASHVRRGLVIRDDLPTMKRWLAILVADPQFIAVDRAALGKRWVERVRRRMPVYSWTIRTAEQRAQGAVHADALIWEADGRPRI
jgi:glycerophosphoryl diester phosphodiesterase